MGKEKKIIFNSGTNNELSFRFRQLPIEVKIIEDTGPRFYILGADDNGELHMIRDREGGSLGKFNES